MAAPDGWPFFRRGAFRRQRWGRTEPMANRATERPGPWSRRAAWLLIDRGYFLSGEARWQHDFQHFDVIAVP